MWKKGTLNLFESDYESTQPGESPDQTKFRQARHRAQYNRENRRMRRGQAELKPKPAVAKPKPAVAKPKPAVAKLAGFRKAKEKKLSEGQKRLTRVGDAMIKKRGGIPFMKTGTKATGQTPDTPKPDTPKPDTPKPDKAMQVQFRKEFENQKSGDARNTPAKLSAARKKGNTKEFKARLARRKDIRNFARGK